MIKSIEGNFDHPEVNKLLIEPRYLVPYISAIIAGWAVYVKPELAPRKNIYGITIYASQLKTINIIDTIKGNKLNITKFFAEYLSINVPITVIVGKGDNWEEAH